MFMRHYNFPATLQWLLLIILRGLGIVTLPWMHISRFLIMHNIRVDFSSSIIYSITFTYLIYSVE